MVQVVGDTGEVPGWLATTPVGEHDEVDELSRLALAAGQGDRVAMAAFVRESQADVWRLCAHLGDRGEADDLTQETYLRALPALASFRGEASARTWLLGVARRVCADAVRRRTRQRALLERLARRRSRWTEAAPAGSVELDQLLGELAPERREAFVLTQVLGCSYEEAAAVCDCPVGTIRSRVARARGDLVDALAGGSDSASGVLGSPP